MATAYMVFDNMTEEADQELRDRSETIFETARKGEFSSEKKPFEGKASLSAEVAELRLILLQSPSGDVLYRNKGWPKPDGDTKYTRQGWLTKERSDGRLWRVISRTSNGYKMRLAIDLREVRDEVNKMVERYLRALPVALILIALGAWWLANRVVRPVQAIIATAEKITAEGLGERVEEVDSDDEIGRLTRVLNRMVARLEATLQQSRRFSADASHELRTPLAVMQGKIESELQRADRVGDHPLLADLLDQIQYLKSIVDSLLMFSRSDSGNLQVAAESVDLSQLVEEVAEDASLFAAEGGIEFEVDVPAGVQGSGDARLMKLAVFNVLQNAVKYNLLDGGRVKCALGEDGVINVTNTGPEITGDDAEKIFERFYRADPSRSSVPTEGKAGFGLGLSLAQVIAEAHGGALWLERSGGGENVFGVRFGRA
ncbi:MAG: two-component system heavy metal sensor histidine kinase CusS [Verrucomicrobiales bacterium]